MLDSAVYKKIIVIVITFFAVTYAAQCQGQDKTPFIRIVNIEVDSAQLFEFNGALKEDIENAVRLEPGVIALYEVADKNHPTRITVFEVFESEAAHKAHQQTPHFLKYKNATEGMVKSALRTEMLAIAIASRSR